MRYAILSDLHGNLPAFQAVLQDAKLQRIDRFLFLGDYFADMPFPNETVDLMRSLNNALIVKGNKENYLKDLKRRLDAARISDMLWPLYWSFQTFRPENLQYLIDLPEQLSFTGEDKTTICMIHAPARLFPGSGMRALGSFDFAQKMRARPFSHREYLTYVERHLNADEAFLSAFNALPEGVYLFGHTHLQWHLEQSGKLLINPGSCGFPLDFHTAPAYTILDCDGLKRHVEERRVPYDVQDAVKALKSSGLYERARPWGDIMIEHLTRGEDRISAFMRLLRQHAIERGDHHQLCSNETWRSAAALWYAQEERAEQ
jgi:predicted phosphodiesterase